MAKKAPPAFPLYDGLSEKKLRALGEKLDKLQDPNGYKHHQLLSKSTEGQNAPLLWHLARHGLVGRNVQSAGLYQQLAENIPDDVTAAEVIAVLRHAPEDMGVLDRGKARGQILLTPGVLASIDTLLVHAYVADPAAVRAAQAELPHSLQLAIAMVRRRAGETIDPAHAREIFEHLAGRHSAEGLAYIDVPRIVDGKPVACTLADDGKVRELAELFGSREDWAALELAWLRSHVAEVRSNSSAAVRNADGLRLASLRDVVYLFGDGYWDYPALLQTIERRGEAPEQLLAVATELRTAGLAPFHIDAPQIKPPPEPRGSGDDDSDDEDGGDDEYSSGDDDYDGDGDGDYDGDGDSEDEEPEPDAGPDNDRVRALACALAVVVIEQLHAQGRDIPAACDEAIDLDRVFGSDGAYVERVRAALGLLGAARAHAVIRRLLTKEYHHTRAALVADVWHDAGVIEDVLNRLDGSPYMDAELLAYCGVQVIPAIAAHASAVGDPKKQAAYHQAINAILGRASAAGLAIDPQLDAHIDVAAIPFSHGGSRVDSILAMLDALPLARWEAVMRANLERGVEAVTLARCLRRDVPDPLLADVLTALFKDPKKITASALGGRLRLLGRRVVAPLRQAFGDTATEASLMRELERSLDDDAFAEFKATLDRPIETRDQELRRLCAALPGRKVTIYRLTRAERAPAADEVGRIGGTPRGVASKDVPKFAGEPMQHVITLDLARFPDHPQGESRSLSLYLPDPGNAEDHEQGELVWRTEAELAAARGSVTDARAIDVEAFSVPAEIFYGNCEGDLARVRRLVYGSHGYAFGGPLWLQDGEEAEDDAFLFQFDESLCPINLGDSGIMYVFDGQITWQCH
jgi:hypothetical protein